LNKCDQTSQASLEERLKQSEKQRENQAEQILLLQKRIEELVKENQILISKAIPDISSEAQIIDPDVNLEVPRLKYEDRQSKKQNCIQFINETWKHWVAKGVLTQGHLKKYDPELLRHLHRFVPNYNQTHEEKLTVSDIFSEPVIPDYLMNFPKEKYSDFSQMDVFDFVKKYWGTWLKEKCFYLFLVRLSDRRLYVELARARTQKRVCPYVQILKKEDFNDARKIVIPEIFQ